MTVNLAFGYEGGNDGASSGGEEGRARALSDKRRGPAAVAASKARTSPGPKAPRTLMAPERTGPRLSRASSKRQLSAKQRELRAFFEQGGHTRHLPTQVRRHATNLWHRDHLDAEEAENSTSGDRNLKASAMNPMVRQDVGSKGGKESSGWMCWSVILRAYSRREVCLVLALICSSSFVGFFSLTGHLCASRQCLAHHLRPQEVREPRAPSVVGCKWARVGRRAKAAAIREGGP